MESSIKYIEGIFPVLISAPHVFAHPRNSIEGRKFKVEELNTFEILKDICERTGSQGISLSNKVDYDPNYDKYSDNGYKQAIKEISKEKGFKYFIDLHGLKDSHQFDIGIYIKPKFENSKKLAYKLADSLNINELRGSLITIQNFRNDDQETLSEYVCTKLNLPAVQIEIARYIREEEELRIAFGRILSNAILSLK